MLNTTVRVSKAWWGVVGLCLGLLNAPAFAAHPNANFSTVFAFDLRGTSAGVVEGSGSNSGMLFGTTPDSSLSHGGTIYKVPKAGGAPVVIYQLRETDGYVPQATLLRSVYDGYLYGTTTYGARIGIRSNSGSGTIFRIAQDGSGYETLHSFAAVSATPNAVTGKQTNADGMYPEDALIEDATYLYGVTPSGGVNGSGTVFRTRKSDGLTEVLHSFAATTLAGNNPSGEGAYPSAPLLLASDGRLYGVTEGGGPNLKTTVDVTSTIITTGTGTIFSLLPVLGATDFQTEHTFNALDRTVTTSPIVNVNGVQPRGALLELPGSPGILIGTTIDGGTPADTTLSGAGTVFRFNTTTDSLVTLYNFDGTTGSSPLGNLVFDSGLVYGLTGSNLIYSIDPAADPLVVPPADIYEQVLLMSSAQGSGFAPALLKAADGDLYGAVGNGNACTSNVAGYGAVFRYSLTTGASSSGYASCTVYDSGGGGAISLWLLALLGLAPPVRRRLFGIQ